MSARDQYVTDLVTNLDEVQENPEVQLDASLFQRVSSELNAGNADELVPSILPKLVAVLPTLQQSPNLVAEIAMRMLDYVSFPQCVALTSSQTLIDALRAPFPSLQGLALKAAAKASAAPDYVLQLTQMTGLVEQLLETWLTIPETQIAHMADESLIQLLRTDLVELEPHSALANGFRSQGTGALWAKIFQDPQTYEVMFRVCSSGPEGDQSLERKTKTQAQARLLAWLPKVLKMSWTIPASSQCPTVDRRYTSPAHRSAGLLGFVANSIIDGEGDVLMHLALIDFYQVLLGTSPKGLDYLVTTGIHGRLIRSALKTTSSSAGDPFGHLILHHHIEYLAAFATEYPSAFASQQVAAVQPSLLVDQVMMLIDRSLKGAEEAEERATVMHLLQAVPRVCLLHPRRSLYLSLAIDHRVKPQTLRTLAVLFHGPTRTETQHTGAISLVSSTQPMCARVLYLRFLSKHPGFLLQLVGLAQTVALAPTALAAIELLSAIATCNWLPCPIAEHLPTGMYVKGSNCAFIATHPTTSSNDDPKVEYILPSEQSLGQADPVNGISALLTFPARQFILPYAIGASQRFSGLVGGLGGAEDAAYRVAAARVDFVRLLLERLEKPGETQAIVDRDDLIVALRKRVSEGIWGGASNNQETAVATMDF